MFLGVLGFMLSHNLVLLLRAAMAMLFTPMVVGVLGVFRCFWASWVSCCLIILFFAVCSHDNAFSPMVVGVLGVFGCLGFHVVS